MCTDRQLRVLQLKAGGLGYMQIARYLLVSKSTVRDAYVSAVIKTARELRWSDGDVRQELERTWRDAA